MIRLCNKYNQVFCNAYNKYYNTLMVNGEISRKESNNLLIIGYIRELMLHFLDEPSQYLLFEALKCIAKNSCLIDVDSLYNITLMNKIDARCNIVQRIEGDCISIIDINKTGTLGLVDTYTIRYSNGNNTTFEVVNGEDAPELEYLTPEEVTNIWNNA